MSILNDTFFPLSYLSHRIAIMSIATSIESSNNKDNKIDKEHIQSEEEEEEEGEEKEQKIERVKPEPVDWKQQEKCYFCVDGKLLKVNESGELVVETSAVQPEAELNKHVSNINIHPVVVRGNESVELN